MMKIGVPTEVKNNERRVALTPTGVRELVARGHDVFVQRGAGEGSRISDASFSAAGACVVPEAADAWGEGDLLVKVKEPVESEFGPLRPDQVLFAYLHLAAATDTARALIDARTTSIAYETVQLQDRSLPLLAPMSEVAGRLSAQVGAYHLMSFGGGRGMLLGGVAGTSRAKVVVIGGGIAGEHAAASALGMGAEVTVLDVSLPRLRELAFRYPALHTRASSTTEIEEQVVAADLVIGSVLIPGATAPKLVTSELVSRMKPGAVLVDIAIDQGGCFEGSHATTHDDPVYSVGGVLYYCVANMPGSVPETSTTALTNATLPYVRRIAEQGWVEAVRTDAALAGGLTTFDGELTNPALHD